MKALVLFASPRRKNTYLITKGFIKGLEENKIEVVFIDVTKLNISHCISCNFCLKEEKCFIKDDMDKILELIKQCEILVLSSPVYFGTVTSYLKVLIDRCQILYNKRFVLKSEKDINKKGYMIFTAGGKNEKMLGSMELVAKFFMLSCGAKLEKMIYFLNTDEREVGDKEVELAYKIAKEITNNYMFNI
ncbi:NADPH-dependent FMN reductase [Caloramator fervidus]|uniref:NADPH-dependent FMN reductase n=1 Tax=Caloramator fervidus TaxID=29344 RepID=A0A1H5UC34_9CLOT|nr:flavodoxin family protein [Caloramator fervidus]SEF71978.1 NADPH-dependent FMN reductase [Caloramator fervidus]